MNAIITAKCFSTVQGYGGAFAVASAPYVSYAVVSAETPHIEGGFLYDEVSGAFLFDETTGAMITA